MVLCWSVWPIVLTYTDTKQSRCYIIQKLLLFLLLMPLQTCLIHSQTWFITPLKWTNNKNLLFNEEKMTVYSATDQINRHAHLWMYIYYNHSFLFITTPSCMNIRKLAFNCLMRFHFNWQTWTLIVYSES